MPATANPRFIALVRPWVERQLGYSFPANTTTPSVDVRPRAHNPSDPQDAPFRAFRIDSAVAVAVSPQWLGQVRAVFDRLHTDQVFSILGTYELSRVTLPGGVAVWGPIPNYVADSTSWRPVRDSRPVLLSDDQRSAIDWNVFWHCERTNAIASFGIYEADRLVALATVVDHGDRVWEIGVDVAPGATGRRLGSAVVSAAGNWILVHGATIHATVAFWNVPSSRNMRSLGMEYVYSVMRGREGPFLVPPQPIGAPAPGIEVYNNYPAWAMNPAIRPKP